MSGNRKLYKTKLCVLYQKGLCSRPSCNFAHGNADLRLSVAGGSSSFNGRRDYRSGDLRDKLGKRYSPNRRYSPGRDARSRHAFHDQKPLSRDRGNSRSMSPARRSERKPWHRKKQHADGESDGSKSLNISDGYEDPKKEYKSATYDKNYHLEEQLKQSHSEIERLEDDKTQLQNILEEKIDEERKLSSRIEDLEIQLDKEQDDCKRITSKIKKFVRAHRHYLKAQEELKRSQARLQQLGDLLGSDISEPGVGEEDSNVNIPSDEEPNGDNKINPRNDEIKLDALSVKRRTHVLSASSEEAKAGNSQKRGRYLGLIIRSEKIIRLEGPARESEYDNKGTESEKAIPNKKEVTNSLSDDYKNKRTKNNNGSTMTMGKVKGFDPRRAVPSTSIAAHAVDELIEAEIEDRSEDMEGTAAYENGVVDKKTCTFYLPPPPPPPIDLNAYKQYEGDDGDVDVEKVDNEMLDIDLNDEVMMAHRQLINQKVARCKYFYLYKYVLYNDSEVNPPISSLTRLCFPPVTVHQIFTIEPPPPAGLTLYN